MSIPIVHQLPVQATEKPSTMGTYYARAQALRTERLILTVELRPPKRGELGWTVPMTADVTEALAQVIDGRGTWDEGECGYGIRVTSDWPEIERVEWIDYEIDPITGLSTGTVKARGVHEFRSVTLVLSEESAETGKVVLL